MVSYDLGQRLCHWVQGTFERKCQVMPLLLCQQIYFYWPLPSLSVEPSDFQQHMETQVTAVT